MRSAAEIEALKNESRKTASDVVGLPPGYIFGLDLSISRNSLFVGPGIANVHGRLVKVTKRTMIEDHQWLVGKAINTQYHVYIDQSGQVTVERIIPAYDTNEFYKQNPATGSRYIGEVQTDDEGGIYKVVSRDPILVGASTVFESGYDPTSKVASLGGRYASAGDGASRVEIFPDNATGISVKYWTGDRYIEVFKVSVGLDDNGDVVLGDYQNGAGVKWDQSEETFKIRGELEQVTGYRNILDAPSPESVTALRAVLDNDYHLVPSDARGNNGNFTGCACTITVYIGIEDKSDEFTYTATPGANVVGSLNGRTYTVTAMSGDEGEVEIVASRSGYADQVCVFKIAKIKAGESTYMCTIVSTDGLIFRPGTASTTLVARVFYGIDEVTDLMSATWFRWTRVSPSPADDLVWNQNHASGFKSIEITPADVIGRTTFFCEIHDQ